jgi:glycosyltransferase involved in cell wall biosynthesis
MKNCLLLTVDFPPHFIGGVSAWAHDLASSIFQDGGNILVLAKRTGDTSAHDNALPYKISRVRGRSWNNWQALWMRLALRTTLGPDTTVIAATWRLATHITKQIHRTNSKLGIAFHGSEITHMETAPAELHRVVDAAHALLPVSHFLKNELVRLQLITQSDPRLHVLPMPLNTQFTPMNTQSDKLICVARPTDLKGTDRAVKLAKAMGRTLHLVGPETAPPGCIAHGTLPREQTLALMAESAACILLPRTLETGRGAEGLGLALLEAAVRSVPTIGCSTGGVPEALGPGLLLSNPDLPDGPLVNQWLEHPQRGQEAREWVCNAHGPTQALSTLQRAFQ